MPDVPEQGRRKGQAESPDVALNTPSNTRELRVDRRARPGMPMMDAYWEKIKQERRRQSAGPLGGYDEYAD